MYVRTDILMMHKSCDITFGNIHDIAEFFLSFWALSKIFNKLVNTHEHFTSAPTPTLYLQVGSLYYHLSVDTSCAMLKKHCSYFGSTFPKCVNVLLM